MLGSPLRTGVIDGIWLAANVPEVVQFAVSGAVVSRYRAGRPITG